MSTAGEAAASPPVLLRSPRRLRRLLVGAAVAALLVIAILLGAGLGAIRIPPGDVVATLLWKLGLGDAPANGTGDVLWGIRAPRVALAMSVGAALSVSGALLQGIFRNPLADPTIVGISSGAAVGASVAIVAGATLLSTTGLGTVAIFAFAGALVTALLVYSLARHEGRTEVVTLILTGIALNAVAMGIVGLMTFMATDEELRSLSFWTLGSLAGATWPAVKLAAPIALLACVLAPLLARSLDAIALGEAEAEHLGVRTERLRIVAIAIAALATGAAVAVAGILSFIGLVVPHVVRLCAGPNHGFLLPASAAGGAAAAVLADLAARTIAVPQEVPLGVVTALAGGPFFLWLLRRTRSEHGAWR
jgi:iron complex transport system permease protein